MKYLGLDLSTVSTGYSIFDGPKLIEYGKIVPSANDTMDRIVEIVSKLENIICNHTVDVVLIEDVFYGSNYLTTKMLNRLAGAAYLALTERHVGKVDFAMPTDARKCFGLLPKSNKANVVSAVNAKYKLDLKRKDDDIADGIVLGYAALYKDTTPDVIFKKSEQQFFKTKIRGMKTPPINGMKPRRKKK